MHGWTTSFPRGTAGFALFLLRICVGAMFFASGHSQELFSTQRMLFILALSCVIFLYIGLLTWIVAILALIEEGVFLLVIHSADPFAGILTMSLCLSVSILGAGAYSVDSLFFGRRRVVLSSP